MDALRKCSNVLVFFYPDHTLIHTTNVIWEIKITAQHPVDSRSDPKDETDKKIETGNETPSPSPSILTLISCKHSNVAMLDDDLVKGRLHVNEGQ